MNGFLWTKLIVLTSFDEGVRNESSGHVSFSSSNQDEIMRLPSAVSQSIRGPLVTSLLILNQGQVTMTTPEPAPPLITSTPTGRRLSLDIFKWHRSPLHDGSSAVPGSNS
ncbi:hypothetical protein TNCV_3484071 [Trichonephila clavipes]|nr:hypothetical protein TNCV_3484071 [Trichonephila clavipes]